MELSSNTKAILLLTAPLITGKNKRSVRPLSARDYGKLAQLLQAHGREPADLLQTGADQVLRECHPEFDIERINKLLGRGFLLSQALENWRSRAIWVISRADPHYPQCFRGLLRQNRPPVLYGCGDATLLDNGGLAVVGSRQISDDLIEYTESVGWLAAVAQCTVVSGGAPGVDQAAIRGALDAGGTSVVVLPAKLENAVILREYRDALLDSRLTLISPYDPRAGWSVGQAMGRNKLIYALSNAALVVESSYNKGGTWPGAVEQLERLHFVPVYTRSTGQPSKGLDGLRNKGALSWGEPRTPDALKLVLASKTAYVGVNAPKQAPLFPKSEECIKSQAIDATTQTASLPQSLGQSGASEISPADTLFEKVEQLLESVDMPTTDSAVAEYLDVSKRQASDWLKRLAQEGKYQKLTKPVRYTRISPGQPSA